MNLQPRIISHISDSIKTSQETITLLADLIEAASQLIVNCLLNDKKVLTCGNGHLFFCPQLFSSMLLDQFERHRPALPVVALTSDITTITTMTDHSQFDDIFAKQIRSLGLNGDLLVVFSDGKHSPMITRAINTAHDKNIAVISLTSNQGDIIGSLLNDNDIEIRVPSLSSAHIQQSHLLIMHCLCDLVDHQLFDN